jgi:hypothetical protein
MDRRTAIKWLAAAAASLSALELRGFARTPLATPTGYGGNPDMGKIYKPGELWPLTLDPAQRRTVVALCDLIIPADADSPAASAVGVPDFIDEWISAPYGAAAYKDLGKPVFSLDRALILEGISWLDGQAVERWGRAFADVDEAGQTAICDDICYLPRAKPEFERAAVFFARFRDLAAGGFYTTPEGTKDLKYVGNVPLARFDGPPPEVLRKVGLL